jgi:hypothetical protein
MSDAANSEREPRGSWPITISLVMVHLIAFGMMYLSVVQMNWAFRDFFNLVGTKPTPRFQSAATVADLTAAHTPIVLTILAIHLTIIFRLSRRTHRWASAYSHGMLLCMGFAGFFSVSCAVHTITWGNPGMANPPNASVADNGIGRNVTADLHTND